ncbi:MAG TPA: hypothetical protein VMW10_06005 [Alphaproteobacteria bacterium]|nr:hypothetical protein [Alphaproteobacteria bacterium]
MKNIVLLAFMLLCLASISKVMAMEKSDIHRKISVLRQRDQEYLSHSAESNVSAISEVKAMDEYHIYRQISVLRWGAHPDFYSKYSSVSKKNDCGWERLAEIGTRVSLRIAGQGGIYEKNISGSEQSEATSHWKYSCHTSYDPIKSAEKRKLQLKKLFQIGVEYN